MSARGHANQRSLLQSQSDFEWEQREKLHARLCVVASKDPDLTIETLAERFPSLSRTNIQQILSRAGIKRSGKDGQWWVGLRKAKAP